jgi:hypothetical protein
MTYHDIKSGPSFGAGYDIKIFDGANKNRKSYANIGSTF